MTVGYLVECYWPGVNEAAIQDAIERARANSGDDVSWLHSVLVIEDEIVLCLVEGPSAEAIYDVTQRAGFPAERVTASIHLTIGRNHDS
jgi:flavin-binding protein dodecin